MDHADPLTAFVEAASAPLDSGHGSGTLQRAEHIRLLQPEVASGNIYAAAVLGEEAAVGQFIALDPQNAIRKGGPREWDALTYLCFSRYLRLDPERSAGFMRTAEVLLNAGANANTGWYEINHQPGPEWESALYGAAGVAHHEALTRLLLERGADPNDEETPYHAPETRDNAAVKVLVESGKLNDDSLATMLLRKADWHDWDGIKLLLERGADPNRMTRWHHTALHQALRRDNALKNIELLLNHGADATLENRQDGKSAVSMAARRGRGDVLELFEQRGVAIELGGVERLLAACARNDSVNVRSIAEHESQLVGELIGDAGRALAEFAANGATEGVRHLLDLGVEIGALFHEGDGYWDIAKNSTALHVAAWRASHATVKLLIERGASVNTRDAKGRTPLQLAVKACVDSYWAYRRAPQSVEALLAAGASASDVSVPSGYTEVDELLRRYGRR
jgi:ankyrin repeat protein